MSPRLRPRRGVTIFELVVALTLTAFVAALGAAAISELGARREAMLAASAATERAGALRAVLQGWLAEGRGEQPAETRRAARSRRVIAGVLERAQRGAARRRFADSPLRRGLDEAARAVPEPALAAGAPFHFRTDAVTPLGGGPALGRLYVDVDPATPERGLTVELRHAALGPLVRRQLDPDVSAMTVEYLAAGTRRWLPADGAAGALETALAARLRFAYGDDVTARLRLLPITVPMRSADAAPGGGS